MELPLVQSQMTGVVPHPPCSKPGFGTTFVAARADGTSTNAATATASVNAIREPGTNHRRDPNHVSFTMPLLIITAAARRAERIIRTALKVALRRVEAAAWHADSTFLRFITRPPVSGWSGVGHLAASDCSEARQ